VNRIDAIIVAILSNMSTEARSPAWTRVAKFVGVPLVGFALVQANSIYPFIRFRYEPANIVASTMSFLLPFVAAHFAVIIPLRWWGKALAILLLLPLLALCVIGAFFESLMIGDALLTGVNPAFEPIASVPMGSYLVGIYRTDCGAPCSFGIYPLQEKQILPGILLVRPLPGFDEASDATYKVIREDTLLLEVPEYFDGKYRTPARSRVYHLKRFLYF
jgi:hypothetical protein